MSYEVGLRPLTVADAPTMAEVLADPSLYEFTGGEPPSADELRRRYAVQVRGHSADGSQEWINLLIVHDPGGHPVGYVQATIPRDDTPTEVAWVVGRRWQGRGCATRAARLLLDRLAQRGVRDVVAHIHPDHAASQAVARRLGMVATDVVVDGETRWAGRTR